MSKELDNLKSYKGNINLKKSCSVSAGQIYARVLEKEGALVMIRKNDPDGEYVNGTLAQIKSINQESISLKSFKERYEEHSIIEQMMSDTYDEDIMPDVECIFDEIEYFMKLNPMLVYEELLDDSKFNAMADVYYKTYGDIVEC